jgi:hypothetical protein
MRGCTCRGPALCPQCRSLAERAGILPPPVVPAVSESVFQRAVMRVAREAGWTFLYHTYKSTKSMGGFPDLILCHRDAHLEPGRYPVLAIELKTDEGQLTKAQEAWLAALAGSSGVVSAVWRPSMWSEMVERLRG